MSVTGISRFDTLLRGGRLLDPSRGIDDQLDVGVRAGKIVAIAKNLPTAQANETIDVTGKLVLPGLIDVHGHVYEHVTRPFGINPEIPGVRSGATTVVDQGTVSPFTFHGFRKFIVERATTRIYAFISIYLGGGLFANSETNMLAPDVIDADLTAKVIESNRDIIRGIKVHAEAGGYSRWELEPLRRAKEVSRRTGLPVYVHLGQIFPTMDGAAVVDGDKVVREAMDLLDAGDVLAHPFRPDTGCFLAPDGSPYPAIREAIARGVRVDVGRGWTYSFATARRVLDGGIRPDTVGADLHGLYLRPDQRLINLKQIIAAGVAREDAIEKISRPDPSGRPTLVSITIAHAMTELLALGLPLMEVVAMATSNAARLFGGEAEHGTLQEGLEADISVLDLQSGSWILRDNAGGEVGATQRLVPLFVLRAGVRHNADIGVVEPDVVRPARAAE